MVYGRYIDILTMVYKPTTLQTSLGGPACICVSVGKLYYNAAVFAMKHCIEPIFEPI